MSKNLSPAEKQFTTFQYARGASRSIQVGLKMVEILGLESDQALNYLQILSAVIQDKIEQVPIDPRLRTPFLDSCANEALHRMSKG